MVDCVISTPSSIVLTAMLHDFPVCQLIYRDTPLLLQSGWMMHKSSDIDNTIQTMLTASEERMCFQRKQVSDNYVDCDVFFEIKSRDIFSTPITDEFLNTEAMRLLNSPFNFNFEYMIRKAYRYLKSKWL